MKKAPLGMIQLTGRYHWPRVTFCWGTSVRRTGNCAGRTRECGALGLGIHLLNAQCTKRFKQLHSPVYYNSTHLYLAFPVLPLLAMWPWHFIHCRPQVFSTKNNKTSHLRVHVKQPANSQARITTIITVVPNLILFMLITALSLWSGFSEWKITSWWP